MNETTILLSSSSSSSGDPNSELTKPDFLATVEPLVLHQSSSHAAASSLLTLPFELIINEYTREPWSLGSSSRRGSEAPKTIANDKKDNEDDWISCYLVSTDGRNRLAGFMAYLRERKKAAVARIPSETHHNGAILVVPYDPPPIPTEIMMNVKDGNQLLFVKYLKDASILQKNKESRKCSSSNNIGQSSNDALPKTQHQDMKLNHQQKQQQQQQQQQKTNNQHLTAPQGQSTQHNQSSSTTTIITTMVSGGKKTTKGGGGGGLLGNLLGAKRKTETALDMVRTSTKKSSTATTDDDVTTLFDPTSAAGCINTFRTKIMSDLTMFKSQSTVHVTKIPILLSTVIKPITSHDEREKITMDVLRFAIYEQVEEVGEDTWIAVKEPTDFIDECIIVVYKAGYCPPEILMEMNKGELPTEIRGAVQYMAQAETKAMERKGKKLQEAVLKNSGKMKDQQQQQFDDNVVILNTNKRDRRTLEQIQKDLLDEDEDVKRNRFGV
jgi:hypothetical protein